MFSLSVLLQVQHVQEIGQRRFSFNCPNWDCVCVCVCVGTNPGVGQGGGQLLRLQVADITKQSQVRKLEQGNIFRSVCQEFCSHPGAVHAWRYGYKRVVRILLECIVVNKDNIRILI